MLFIYLLRYNYKSFEIDTLNCHPKNTKNATPLTTLLSKIHPKRKDQSQQRQGDRERIDKLRSKGQARYFFD